MLYYIRSFLRAIFWQNFNFWFSLLVAYTLGTGFFADYEEARAQIQTWFPGIMMPEVFPLWWIGIPFLGWVIFRLADKEARRHMFRARLLFDKPYIEHDVPLYNRWSVFELIKLSKDTHPIPVSVPKSELIARNNIAKIVVRNSPYDFDNGRPVEDAYAIVTIFDRNGKNEVLEFDFPRWTENPKPGYEGNPSDHFPHEWNYRTLRPNQTRNTIDFVIKNIDETVAYGFSGASQRESRWQSDKLRIQPGEYIVRIALFGTGLRNPPRETWLRLKNPDQNGEIHVTEAKKPTKHRMFELGAR